LQHRDGEGDAQAGVGVLQVLDGLEAAVDRRRVGDGGAFDVEVEVVDVVVVDHALVRGGERGDVRAGLAQLDPAGAAERDDHLDPARLGPLDVRVGGGAADGQRVAPDRGAAAADDEGGGEGGQAAGV